MKSYVEVEWAIKSIVLKDGKRYTLGVNGVGSFRRVYSSDTIHFDVEICLENGFRFMVVDYDFIATMLFKEKA